MRAECVIKPCAFIVSFLLLVQFGAACRRSKGAGAQPSGGRASSVPIRTPGAPTPEQLVERLGVGVDGAPGEVNQYLIRAKQGSVDLSKIGKIHTDVGYAIGVTLPNGVQIGFRFEPLPQRGLAPTGQQSAGEQPKDRGAPTSRPGDRKK